jgi:uncharacterized membrane protein
MLLVAGLFPAVERRFGWKVFSVLPPIVLTYLLVTALAVSGLWQVNAEIKAAQSMLVSHMVPALLFLLMINCDLRAIWRLGPRVLGVFACTSVSLFVAFIASFLIYRHWLPGNQWQPLAALSGSWVGGTANMIAVKQAIAMPDGLLAMSLLTDALCYSMWVALLFSLAKLAPAFNRWTRATSSAEMVVAPVRETGPVTADSVLLVGFAKLFRFDLYLCGISSLAHIGGVAATPILAASYSAALVPVGILLALLGYILGTGFGLLMATIMSSLAIP